MPDLTPRARSPFLLLFPFLPGLFLPGLPGCGLSPYGLGPDYTEANAPCYDSACASDALLDSSFSDSMSRADADGGTSSPADAADADAGDASGSFPDSFSFQDSAKDSEPPEASLDGEGDGHLEEAGTDADVGPTDAPFDVLSCIPGFASMMCTRQGVQPAACGPSLIAYGCTLSGSPITYCCSD